jgi:hypothetical protein
MKKIMKNIIFKSVGNVIILMALITLIGCFLKNEALLIEPTKLEIIFFYKTH